MRIVQILPDFGLGGIQKAGCILAARMAAQGHDTLVLARAAGPRMEANPIPKLQHRVASEEATLAAEVETFRPDIVHVHHHNYCEGLLHRIHGCVPDALIVVTPVFGRPPQQPSVSSYARTVCVGLYTFYRLCRWLGVPGDVAIDRGIAYVPLTPWEPPQVKVSATDDPSLVRERRIQLGLNGDHQVIGRLGRDAPEKWHPDNQRVINSILQARQDISWLSVGFPECRGRESLQKRWGNRALNISQTSDASILATAVSAMDVQLFLSCAGECFASTICEAAGLGVPTVALATPLRDNGQYEQVISGTTGRLVRATADAVQSVLALLGGRDLRQLKIAARQHAWNRWHVDRVTDDLLSLYQWWQNRGTEPPYVGTIRSEYRSFASGYRSEIVRLMSRGPMDRAVWRAALASAECWPLFRLGGQVKRLIRK